MPCCSIPRALTPVPLSGSLKPCFSSNCLSPVIPHYHPVKVIHSLSPVLEKDRYTCTVRMDRGNIPGFINTEDIITE